MTRRLLLAGVALLYVLSIPWYRDADAAVGVLWGMPDWVTVALGCYVGAAFLNAAAWLLSDVSDSSPEPSDSERRRDDAP